MAAQQKRPVIKFVQDHVVQDERTGTPQEEAYKKGQRKAFSEQSARHFVSRGKAVYVTKGAKD